MYLPPMPVAEVQFYDVVLWVHITAFFIAFGPTYVYGVFYAMAGPRGPEAVIAVGKGVEKWDRTGLTAGGTLALLSGIYLVSDRWEFSDFFVSWGVIAILLVLGMTHGYFLPRDPARHRARGRRAGRRGDGARPADRQGRRGHGPGRDPHDLRDDRQAVPLDRIPA